MKLCFFDTETTGKEADDQILQFGAIYGSFDGKEFHEERRINQYINVTKDIHPEAEKIHGINKDMLKSFGYMDDYVDEILGYIKKADYVVGHNIEFDIGKLQGDCIRIGKEFDWDVVKSICTMKKTIDIVDLPGKKRPKLSELYRHLFGKDFNNAHDAMSDIEATKDCFIELIRIGEITFDSDPFDDQSGFLNNKEDDILMLEKMDSMLGYNTPLRMNEMIALFSNIGDKEARGPDGITSLMMLSIRGDDVMVKMLLEEGADVNIQDQHGTTALMYAKGRGNQETVKRVLSFYVSGGATDENGGTNLKRAGREGHKKIVEMLIEKGANPYLKVENGIISLIYASTQGHNEIVEALLEDGIDVNIQDEKGATALIYASVAGNKETVEILLKHGANSNIQGNDGVTALILSSYTGHIRIVEMLLEYGADVNIQDKNGGTALIYANNECHKEIVKILSTTGNNIRTKSIDGEIMFEDNSNTEEISIEKFISGGNGSKTSPFVLLKDNSYIIIEYLIIKILYGEYKIITQETMIGSGGANIDVISIEHTEDKSLKETTIYFDLINN